MLRRLLIGYGIVAVAGALALILMRALPGLAIYLLLNGLVIVAAILLERGRYQPRIGADPTARLQATGERFIDPTSGRLVEVRFDPQTGTRHYVEPRPDEKSPRP